VGGIARLEDGGIDYSKDFFSQKAYLTVSGQMQGEYYACALSNIYTFGPTFRAENSHTSRHLAEFWMIEPEIAFCDLTDDMQCAEDYVRFCCQSLLKTCRSVSPPPHPTFSPDEKTPTLACHPSTGCFCFWLRQYGTVRQGQWTAP